MTRLLISVFFAIAVAAAGGDGHATRPFKITTKQENDRVDVKVEKDKLVFSVHSPSGISHADIERTDAKWSNTVVLRLHLTGLENIQITNGKVKLAASVSSQDGTVRLWKDGQEDSPLDRDSPYGMEIRMASSDGKPATSIPLKDGYFEMSLPKAFLEGNPNSITVNWIDFYRN
jgi:hypothetical protein